MNAAQMTAAATGMTVAFFHYQQQHWSERKTT
jgi:hypothetical protein